MADNGHGTHPQLMDQLRQIVDHVVGRIIAVADPVAVAMAAMVHRHDMVVFAQLLGDPVPAPRVVAPAMDQHQRRLAAIAPVEIMQPQPLRNEGLRSRSGV